MTRVKDKVCIVTGAASGMGRADAIRLAAEGAKVVLTDLNERDGQAAAAEIGENALFIKHNVRFLVGGDIYKTKTGYIILTQGE